MPEPASLAPAVRTLEKTRARLVDLKPHPRNPRKITPARLAQLMRTLKAEPEMLEARPLIALPDGTIVAGNQRWLAARELGWDSIPVVFADLSAEEITRWMLLDNRPFGEDDRDAVAALIGELEAADSDLELTGYDPADLDAMLRELHRPAADYAGPFGGERTVDGDVWSIARDYAPDHPTPKPVELVERALAATTHRGNSVYDPFAGAGSVVIAAERLGLRALAMEIDPGYCDVIRQRYADYTSQPELAP